MLLRKYDESGNIIGLKYNNTQYYYVKNLQGDIIGILDNNLTQVVSYTYDSWGKIISIKDANGNEITDTTNIGLINPYRYRSYRYDAETELYYLNSRYYNPEWGRFINADGTTLDTGADLLGHNMYAYCANNPINNADPTGEAVLMSVLIIGTAILFGGATVTQAVINKKDVKNAEEMFFNAITGTTPSSNTLNSLANKAKTSPQIKAEVQKAIEANNGKDFSNYVSENINFSSGDLYLSIGKVTKTTISGIKNQDNSWNISVRLYDRYNFEEWRKMNSFGSIANNLGFIAEKTGTLTPYDWDISFSFTYYEE